MEPRTVDAVQLLHVIAPVVTEAITSALRNRHDGKTQRFLQCMRTEVWIMQLSCTQVAQSRQETGRVDSLSLSGIRRLTSLRDVLCDNCVGNAFHAWESKRQSDDDSHHPDAAQANAGYPVEFHRSLDRYTGETFKRLWVAAAYLSPEHKTEYLEVASLIITDHPDGDRQFILDDLKSLNRELKHLVDKIPGTTEKELEYPDTWSQEESDMVQQSLDDLYEAMDETWPECGARHDHHPHNTLFHASAVMLRFNGLWSAPEGGERTLETLFLCPEAIQGVEIHSGVSLPQPVRAIFWRSSRRPANINTDQARTSQQPESKGFCQREIDPQKILRFQYLDEACI